MDRQIHKRLNDKGSIALEYVMMLPFFCFVFFGSLFTIFVPGTGYTEKGKLLIAYFQRILVGISMPIP